MKCLSCDQEIPDEARRCPSCRMRFGDAESTEPETRFERRPPKSSAEKDLPTTPLLRGTPVSSAPSGEGAFLPGAQLAGRYRIVGVLGRGGMGVVYRADDLKLEQTVALKFLPESVDESEEKLASLLHEVRIARRISHPNVCSVYDIGEEGGRHFISMKYVDGQDLSSLLAQVGRLPREKGHHIARQICQGLHAAHEKGVLHRDLKPANLLIDRGGNASITDFGLASFSKNLKEGGSVVGTPAYMSPEQHQGREVSQRTDLYALGLVLYEMYTGQKPFRAHLPLELARLHCETPPPPPSERVPDLEPAVESLILRCLAKDPVERPASAAEAAQALPGLFGGEEGWRPEPGRELPQRPHWILESKLGTGGFGEAWCALHKKTQERRVFKFCFEKDKLRSLQREITLFLLLKGELGERSDITRILDWNFEKEPYFIESEYTPGGNLAEWSESRGGLEEIPLKDRLELIAQVAEALAAAHSVGVLHKDVKPANVLVTADRELGREDGAPRAKLTDFGIGFATDRSRLEEAGLTAAGMTEAGSSLSGTRLYMSPELVEGKGATLESDVYALGVLLYQIVVGDFSRALVHGWRQDVEDEVLAGDIAEAVHRSPRKRLKAQQLAERLRHLEERRWIFEKKKREQQEAEATRLALARAYRRRKLVLTAVGALLLFAISISLLAYRLNATQQTARSEAARANQEAERANQEAERANQEAERARQAAEEAQQLSEFLVEVMDVKTPEEFLDRSAQNVEELRDQPELQAELMYAIGKHYRSLGRYEKAMPLVEKALELTRGRSERAEGKVGGYLESLAELCYLQGDRDRAEELYQEAIDHYLRWPDAEAETLARPQFELARLLFARQEFAEAESFARATATSLLRALPIGSWQIARARGLEGISLVRQGRYREAEERLLDAYTSFLIELGKSAPETRTALERIVELYESWDRPAMAIRYRGLLAESSEPR